MNTVVFIVSCLLGTSLGHPVDINLIASSFSDAVQKIEVQKLEQYVDYGDFLEKFAKLNEALISDITTELFRQARLQSHLLINTISSLKSKLEHEVVMEDSYSAKYMEEHLNHLNQRLQTFLEFMSGEIELAHNTLAEIQDRKKPIHYFVKYHSLKSLFLTMGNIIDTHMSNIDLLLHKIYSTGWENARGFYQQLQNQFREEFLHGSILSAVRVLVNEILEDKLRIEPFVQPETWATFETIAANIKMIFDEKSTPSETGNRDTTGN